MALVNDPNQLHSLENNSHPQGSTLTAERPYVDAFLNVERPKDAFDIIQNRMRKAKILNEEIADYFRERALVEDHYVKSLQKLSKKIPATERSALGNFTSVWECLHGELNEIASIHSTFMKKINEEVETPIRDISTSDDWVKVKEYDSSLLKIVKEWEDRSQKMHKHKIKAEKSTGKKLQAQALDNQRLDEARKALDETTVRWLTIAGELLPRYQSLDEARLQNLQESIVRFELSQSEICRGLEEVADRTMKEVTEFEVKQEISRFCANRSRSFTGSNVDELTPHTGNGVKFNFDVMKRKSRAVTSIRDIHDSSYTKFENFSDEHKPDEPVSSPGTSEHTTREVRKIESSSQLPKVVVDAEGYSIPPADTKPWDTSSQAVSEGQDSDGRSDTTSTMQTEKMYVDIKPETIHEQDEEENARALTRVKTQLLSRSQTSLNGRRHRRREGLRHITGFTESMYFDSSETPTTFERTGSQFGSPESASPTSSEFTDAVGGSVHSDSDPPTLQASISETISVMSKGGAIAKILITGEINVRCLHFPTRDSVAPFKLKITNLETLEKAVPNASYMKPAADGTGEFDIDLGMLALSGGKPVTLLKYQVRSDAEDKTAFTPLTAIPKWKFDEKTTSVAVAYQRNEACHLTGPVEFSVLVPVNTEVGSVLARPLGHWNPETKKMYWQIEGFDLSQPAEWKTVVAQFETEVHAKPAPAAVKFLVKGQSLSQVDLQLVTNAQEEDGRQVVILEEVARQVSSGKFFVAP